MVERVMPPQAGATMGVIHPKGLIDYPDEPCSLCGEPIDGKTDAIRARFSDGTMWLWHPECAFKDDRLNLRRVQVTQV